MLEGNSAELRTATLYRFPAVMRPPSTASAGRSGRRRHVTDDQAPSEASPACCGSTSAHGPVAEFPCSCVKVGSCHSCSTNAPSAFRTAKSLRDTRPIFHKCDETICGPVLCAFLTLVMQKELFLRMAEAGSRRNGPTSLCDRGALAEVAAPRAQPCAASGPAADHHRAHRRQAHSDYRVAFRLHRQLHIRTDDPAVVQSPRMNTSTSPVRPLTG